MRFSLGLSNHGTELTGRYRAQVGVAWDAPLGLGDAFSASYVHALDPQQSNQGALSYTIPITPAPGFEASLSSQERRVGKGCVSTCRSRGSRCHYKNNI